MKGRSEEQETNVVIATMTNIRAENAPAIEQISILEKSKVIFKFLKSTESVYIIELLEGENPLAKAQPEISPLFFVRCHRSG